MKSRFFKPMFALLVVLAVGLVVAVGPAVTAPLILDWRVIGTGGPTETGGTCGITFAAGCTASASGDALGQHIGNSTYTLSVRAGTLSLDNGALPVPGLCFAASGTSEVTAADGSLVFLRTVGLLCKEAGPLSPFHYNGTYRIDPGPSTTRFDEAVGGGSLTATFQPGTVNFIKIDGTINF